MISRTTWSVLGSMTIATLAIACSDQAPRPFAGPTLEEDADRIEPGNECNTGHVVEISQQLVEVQMRCVSPGAFVSFEGHPNIVLAPNVFPYMQASARDALWRAADSGVLHVSSAFRTLAQQFVLYESGACGAAAKPGNSNHQSGRAIDLSNWSAAKGRMTGAGCGWPNIPNDPVHFDCAGADLRADSVRAFQILWNINNPNDTIGTNGVYGPETEARLRAAPSWGFATLGECGEGGQHDATDPRYFDAAFYLDVHGDLEAVFGDDTGAGARHWIDHGRQEGRMAHPGFSPTFYLATHDDLRAAFGDDHRAALVHWLEYGIAEGRAGAPSFDAHDYLARYPDLSDAFGSDAAAAFTHWNDFGLAEGRRASPEFDPRWYLDQNPDVAAAYGAGNFRGALIHWIRYGRIEGRPGAGS